MSNKNDTLSDDEVRQIVLLVETLEKSSFDCLQLGVGNLKVTVGKGSVLPGAVRGVPDPALAFATPVAEARVPAPAAPAGAGAPLPAAPEAPMAPAHAAGGPATDGTVAIMAPMMGRFYAKPEPGSAPFVSVGAQVSADSTVGLIEVMKVFTAVPAGVDGAIAEICVQDAEFIEYGHILFRVRPSATASDPGLAGAKR